MALLSSCTTASATHAWHKLCCCPAVATQTVPEEELLQNPWQSHLLWEEWLVPAVLSKGTEMHVQQTGSSLAGSCARTWQIQGSSTSPAGLVPFILLCDKGTSFFRGHFKPSQDLASLLHYLGVSTAQSDHEMR